MKNKKGTVSYEVLRILARSKKPLLSAEVNQEIGRTLNTNVLGRLVAQGFVVSRPITPWVLKPLVYSLNPNHHPQAILKSYREGNGGVKPSDEELVYLLKKSGKPLSASEIARRIGHKAPYAALQRLMKQGKVSREKKSPGPFKYTAIAQQLKAV